MPFHKLIPPFTLTASTPSQLDREATARHKSALACEKALWGQVRFLMCDLYSWFLREVTKIQTKGLSILQSFYFHEVSEHLKTDIFTSFNLLKVLRFVIVRLNF